MYAFGELILSQRLTENPTPRWKRALEAVNAAFPRSRSEGLAKSLEGLRLFLEAAIAKRKADPDLLYRAGPAWRRRSSPVRGVRASRAPGRTDPGSLRGREGVRRRATPDEEPGRREVLRRHGYREKRAGERSRRLGIASVSTRRQHRPIWSSASCYSARWSRAGFSRRVRRLGNTRTSTTAWRSWRGTPRSLATTASRCSWTS